MSLDKMRKAIGLATKKYVSDISGELVSAVKQEVPVDTGLMRNSVKRQKDGSGYLVGHDATILRRAADGYDYGAGIYFGTRPHKIEPKNASVLAFPSGGKTVFAKSVNHPGTRANKFLLRAVDKKVGRFQSKFKV